MLPWLITYGDDEPGEMVYKTDTFPDNILRKFLFEFEKKSPYTVLSSRQLTSMERIIISDIIVKFSYVSFLEMFKSRCFFQVDNAVGVDTLLFPCKETSMVGINNFFIFFSFLLSCHSKKSLHIFFSNV